MFELLKILWVEVCNISITNKIALLIVLITALSAEYARQAASQSRKANDIAVQGMLRSERLSIYRGMMDFLHYCSVYSTMFSKKMVEGTHNLSERRDRFKWEIRRYGRLCMPKVEELIKEIISNSATLQRVLDRSVEKNPKPIDSSSKGIYENIDKLIEWFSEKEKKLDEFFEPHI